MTLRQAQGERALSPSAARVKRAVRQAVSLLGGVDGAAATVNRGRSTVGRWISLNDADLPCVDSALAMDEVLSAMGHGPMIISALAFEVGHVALDICAPEGSSDIGALLAAKAEQSGAFMAEVARGYADGHFDRDEKLKSVARLDDVIRIALRLRAALAEGAG